MIPTVSEVLETIKAVANCITEGFKWAQTDDGKKTIAKWSEDRAAWDAFWANAASGIKSLFTGKLFQ
jgi:hypothetical protein